MTGLLRIRYQAFRQIGMTPKDALISARESLEAVPSTSQFAAALAELEYRLKAHLLEWQFP